MSDGMMLKKGTPPALPNTPMTSQLTPTPATARSPLAGNWVSQQIRLMHAALPTPLPLRPYYTILTKTPVDAGQPPNFTPRKFEQTPHPSFHALQEERLLSEFKESCVQIWNPMLNGEKGLEASVPMIRQQANTAVMDRSFEFPDGRNDVFGVERFRVAEGLFDPKAAYTDGNTPAPEAGESIQSLCARALQAVDVDLRQGLLNNIVSTGGTSVIQGFNDRLHWELSSMYQGTKVRIHSPSNMYERKYGPWIGGSILASLGSFHQLWISRKEYEEVGAGIVEKRCK